MPGLERLPCGCRVGTDVIDGERTFLIEPCSLTCDTYRFAIEESRKRGNRERVVDLTDVRDPREEGT